MSTEPEKTTCACGNAAVPYRHPAGLNLRLDDGEGRCMPCQLTRRAHAARMFVIILTLFLGVGGALSGEPHALWVLLGGPLVWVLSIPYLRSAESERGPNAHKS